jgi:membrane protease YdiL (CAAX protease family)
MVFGGEVNRLIDLDKLFRIIFVSLITITIILMIFSFPLGAYTVYNTEQGKNVTNTEIDSIHVFILGLPILIPAPISIGVLFALEWVVYLFLFIVAFFSPGNSLPRVITNTVNHGLKAAFQNTIFVIAFSYTSLLIAVSFIDLLQNSIGIPTGSLPEIHPIIDFVWSAYAPIVEEIGFRVTMIGLVSFLMLRIRGIRVNPLKILYYPGKYLFSHKEELNLNSVYITILISGLFFGAIHFFGGGWEIGKATTASLAGIVLGFVYVYYGIAGAILLHWSFNYFAGSYYYAQEVAGIEIFTTVDFLITMTGIISMIFLLIYAIRRRFDNKE